MLSCGQVHDSKIAVNLLKTTNIKNSHILADRAYGSEEIRSYITSQQADYVIPPKQNTKEPWTVDWHLYYANILKPLLCLGLAMSLGMSASAMNLNNSISSKMDNFLCIPMYIW